MATQEHFLVCTNDYKMSSVGLFRNFECIDSCTCDNKLASKQFFIFIDELLQRNNLSLQGCSFLAVNQGPGPFTTLRVIIASINGLAFATKKPLVGINSLETFVREQSETAYDYVIALNNAYCDDVYYAILDTKKNECISGCAPFENIIEMLNNLPLPLQVLDNKSLRDFTRTERISDTPPTSSDAAGVVSRSEAIKIKIIGGIAHEKRIELGDRISKNIVIPEPCPEYASLEALGKEAYQLWLDNKNITSQAIPLYLKNYTVKV